MSKIIEIEVIGSNKEVYTARLKNPDFEQRLHALSMLEPMTLFNQVRSGKQIFDFCNDSSDEEFKKNYSLMSSLCMHLCTDYVLPDVYEVKKK